MTTQQDNLMYSNYMASAQKERVLSAIKELVNADSVVNDVKFQLTGKKQITIEKDGEGVIQEVVYHAPLINDYGVNKIIADLRSYIQSNVVLGYMEKDAIHRRSRAYYTNVCFELARNIVKYGVMSKENHAKIRTILDTNFYSALSRAYNGMTLLTALKNISVSEIRQIDQPEVAGKGLMGVLKR